MGIAMLFLLVFIFKFFALVQEQNLVLIGGALQDDNADIYGKVVDLAVSLI